jgi:uncharacterized membrane protein
MSATTSEQLASDQLAAGTVATTAPAEPLVQRIRSIDLMRGIVMIIMTIDHARDYYSPFPYDPTDLSQASPWLFLTRWITHYCAPTFMFLAGTSAFLYARNTGASRGQLQRFLLSRGLWLVFLELTWVSFSWRFDFNGLILQVIWALGWCMVILAGLLYLPRKAIAVVGLLAVFGHNALDGIHAQDFAHNGAVWVALWSVLHQFHFFLFDSGYSIALGYPLLPWFGVMALGYCFGDVLMLPAAQRDRRMISLGLSAIILFLLLRLTNLYGEAQLWSANPRGTLYTALGVLNVTKYPPSLLYLLMTLGPVLLLLPLLERARGAWTSRVAVFGKVPMFFYLLHIPLLHLGSFLLWTALYGQTRQPFGNDPLPAGYHPSILYAYLAWAAVILILYPLCRWYSGYKSRNKQMWWLSYL